MKHNKDEAIDWESARWEYENTKITMSEIAKKYGTYPMRVTRVSREQGWVKFVPNRAKDLEKKQVSNPSGLLNTVAVRKVQEIVAELGFHYSPVDEPLIIIYAKNYEMYLTLQEEVDAEGVVCTSAKTGVTYPNPRFYALQSVISNLAKLGDKLGLSIASRKRMGLDLGDKPQTSSLFDFVDTITMDELDV